MNVAKWIGGGLGWTFAGPIGGLIGFALGAMLDNASGVVENQQAYTQQRGQRTNRQAGDFGMSLIILSAAVMKADNKIMRSELDFVKAYMVRQFGEAQTKELVSALKEVLKQPIPTRQVCMQIRANMVHPQRLQLLHYLFGVAHADGKAHTAELHVLNTMARYLGISQKDFYSINAMFGGGQYQGTGRTPRQPSAASAYAILEIDKSASDDEVKKAYRKMAKKYHPDKVASLGPEFQKAAKEKFQKVQQAYETVKKARGMI
jgi:DnaJ like chaperone protein